MNHRAIIADQGSRFLKESILEGIEVLAARGGGVARSPRTTTPSRIGTRISPSRPTNGARSAMANSPAICGATSSKLAKSRRQPRPAGKWNVGKVWERPVDHWLSRGLTLAPLALLTDEAEGNLESALRRFTQCLWHNRAGARMTKSLLVRRMFCAVCVTNRIGLRMFFRG